MSPKIKGSKGKEQNIALTFLIYAKAVEKEKIYHSRQKYFKHNVKRGALSSGTHKNGLITREREAPI